MMVSSLVRNHSAKEELQSWSGSERLDTPGDDGLVVGAQPLSQGGAPVLVRQERHPSPHLPDEQIDESPEENQLFVSVEVESIARNRSPLSCAHMAGGNQALEDTEARRRPLLGREKEQAEC